MNYGEDMLERAKEKMVGSRRKPGRKKQIFGLFEDRGKSELYNIPGAEVAEADYEDRELMERAERYRPGGVGSLSRHARGAARGR